MKQPKPTHAFTYHIPYADVDQMGFVYYANYLVYFEMARSDMMRALGLPYKVLEKKGVFLPVVEAHVSYKAPARYEDLICVHTSCLPFQKLRMHIDYKIYCQENLLVVGYTKHVCMSEEGRPLRPDPELVKALG